MYFNVFIIFRMIDDIDDDIQRTDTRLVALTKRVNKAIRNSSGKFIYNIVYYVDYSLSLSLSLSRSLSNNLYCYTYNSYCININNVFCSVLIKQCKLYINTLFCLFVLV